MLAGVKKWKDRLQIALATIISGISVWFSSGSITQTLGVVYKIGNGFYNSAIGIISQDEKRHHVCTLRVLSPFTELMYNITNNSDGYHYLDQKYMCRWSDESLYNDSLCFDDFTCQSLKLIRSVNIVCSSLFLIGFFLAGVLWMFRNSRWKFRISIWSLSTLLLVFSFVFSKVSASYFKVAEVKNILEKISSIVNRKGGLEIEDYDVTVSEYDFKTAVSGVLFDISSGIGITVIVNGIKLIKRLKGEGGRKVSNEIELTERFLPDD